MSKSDSVFVETFEAKLHEMFPDILTRGTIQNSELVATMKALNTT